MSEIIVEPGCMDRLARIKDSYSGLFLISDDNLFPLCGERIKALAGDRLKGHFVFPHGENSKNMNTALSVLEAMAESGLDRAGAVVAPGGGVTGDIAGLCASLYMRGVSLIMIPTSLLAMIDSSVGGKNGVNFSGRKNLIGSFHTPEHILCDTDMLDTLPPYYITDGMGELIKYAFIEGNAFPDESDTLHHMLSDGIEKHLSEAVRRCIDIKLEIVRRDPYDLGERHILNFGHTAGHAIESAGKFDLSEGYSHGRAVAVGMAVMADVSHRLGICGGEVCDRLAEYLSRYSLPRKCHFDADTLMPYIAGDKKASGSNISLVLPCSLSRCLILPTEREKIYSLLNKCL